LPVCGRAQRPAGSHEAGFSMRIEAKSNTRPPPQAMGCAAVTNRSLGAADSYPLGPTGFGQRTTSRPRAGPRHVSFAGHARSPRDAIRRLARVGRTRQRSVIRDPQSARLCWRCSTRSRALDSPQTESLSARVSNELWGRHSAKTLREGRLSRFQSIRPLSRNTPQPVIEVTAEPGRMA